MVKRKIPDQEQIPGQVPKVRPESDPIGINSEGGVTTNEGGDPPGSDLEVEERESPPMVGNDRKDYRPVKGVEK